MSYQYSPYLLPLFAAAIISFLAAAYVWPRRQTPGATYLALMAITVTPWTLGYALEIAATSLEMKLLWGKSQYVGIVFAPYFWVLFALAYTNQNRPQLQRIVSWLALLPLTTLVLVFTTEWHSLHWRDMFIKETGSLSVLGVTYGPWFWIHFISSYLFLFSGTLILLRALWRMSELYQAQIAAVLVAIISPWIANILYFTGFNLLSGLDLTPFAFTISIVALVWGIFGYRLGDILPVARDLVIEAMRDGMIVLDRRGRVADINNAASRMIGIPAAHAIGTTMIDLFQPWPHILEQVQNEQEGTAVLTIGEGDGQRHYELTISKLYDAKKLPIGQVITLHDKNAVVSPPPQFAVHRLTRPVLTAEPTAQDHKYPFFQTLINFVTTPPKTDLPIPPDVNPGWVQTRERAFTLIMRATAVLGTATIIVALPYLRTAPLVLLAYATVVVLAWILGLARNIPFVYRNTIFLLFVYALGVFETINFGFSAESFAFFFALVMLAVFMAEFRGGVTALVISVITLGFWGWQIGTGNHVPGATTNVIPGGVGGAASSVAAFVATAGACLAAATIMTRSLNRAWQQESQALNLLGQERDLLEQRVAERTRDLSMARDQALQASSFKSQLLAKVSHELRTPLGVILGYTELLRDETFGPLSPRQKNITNEVIESTEFLSSVVGELLDEAQFETSTTHLHQEPFALRPWLEQIEAKMVVLAQRKGLTFSVMVDSSLPETVYGDQQRLQQMAINLTGNAIKFTKTGSVQLHLARPNPDHWAIIVSDTGPGIPEEAQTYIFEPFRQVDGSITREHRGTGLGLSIVRQLAEMMNGRVELVSKVGEGSTFTIWLPLELARMEQAAETLVA